MCALSSSYLWLIASRPPTPPPAGCAGWWSVEILNLLTSRLHGSQRDEVSSCGCWPVALKAHHSPLIVFFFFCVREMEARHICKIIVKLILCVFEYLCFFLCFWAVKMWKALRRRVHVSMVRRSSEPWNAGINGGLASFGNTWIHDAGNYLISIRIIYSHSCSENAAKSIILSPACILTVFICVTVSKISVGPLNNFCSHVQKIITDWLLFSSKSIQDGCHSQLTLENAKL